ncbi:MAG: archaetidylserine decarboxylase [Gammaproteobacteria bacterium]
MSSQPPPGAAQGATLSDHLKALPTYALPHHGLSSVMHALTRVRWSPFKNAFIRFIVNAYDVDVGEAADPDFGAYEHFNAFFTRELKEGARPLPEDANIITSPADGRISQIGQVENGRIFQAKGQGFSLEELLGGPSEWTRTLDGGPFATVYLSPRDYHRVHMPVDGTLRAMVHVPGRLFSVAPHNVRAVPRLFARNERVVTLWDTPIGPMAQILVGAIFVSSMDTVWAGTITPPGARSIQRTDYDGSLSLQRGAEMGRFNMGSTVINVFAPGSLEWNAELGADSRVLMGQSLGRPL